MYKTNHNAMTDILSVVEEKIQDLQKQLHFLSNEESFKNYTYYESDKEQVLTEIIQLVFVKQMIEEINFIIKSVQDYE